jgi:N-methylhydantoinase A
VARLLSMPRILVPAFPGVFTAMGMLAGDVERYFVSALPGRLNDLDAAEVKKALDVLSREARDALAGEGVGAAQVVLVAEINMRFRGQELFLPVPLSEPADRESLRAAFLSAYEAIYSYAPTDIVETVSLKLTGKGLRPGKLDFRFPSTRTRTAVAPKETRRVFFGGSHGWRDTPVYQRATMPSVIDGPAIVEATDSTVAIPPDVRAEADEHQNILMTVR